MKYGKVNCPLAADEENCFTLTTSTTPRQVGTMYKLIAQNSTYSHFGFLFSTTIIFFQELSTDWKPPFPPILLLPLLLPLVLFFPPAVLHCHRTYTLSRW